MGPKAKLTDDKKQEMYDAWKGSSQFAAIERFMEERSKIERLELTVTDISYKF